MPLALHAMLNYGVQELHHRALRERAAEILRYYLHRGADFGEVLAQSMHIDLHCVRPNFLGQPVEIVCEHGLGDNSSTSTQQLLEHRNLTRQEEDRPIADKHLACHGIESDVAELQRNTEKIARSPQQCLQAGDEFLERKGFDEIILGTVCSPKTRSSRLPRAVNISTGVVSKRWRISPRTSRPSASGKPRSSTTISNRLARDAAVASSAVGNTSTTNRAAGLAANYSDGIQLPGDVVGDPPEIADVGLADERIGAPLMPPIQ